MFFKHVAEYIRLMVYLTKLAANVMYGIWKISKLKRAPVTVFGGTHLRQNSLYMSKAMQLAHMLANDGIPVLTGGGPGIMEAASCGALSVKKGVITTIGVSVRGLESGIETSSCPRSVIEMQNLAARKWLLIHYSFGFAVFPGGYGTLDELMELLTLIQTKKREKALIILIGKEYWKDFIHWIHNSALKEGLVNEEDVKLFIVMDDIEKAFALFKEHSLNHPFSLFDEK